jgi:hypothetical protein
MLLIKSEIVWGMVVPRYDLLLEFVAASSLIDEINSCSIVATRLCLF